MPVRYPENLGFNLFLRIKITGIWNAIAVSKISRLEVTTVILDAISFIISFASLKLPFKEIVFLLPRRVLNHGGLLRSLSIPMSRVFFSCSTEGFGKRRIGDKLRKAANEALLKSLTV